MKITLDVADLSDKMARAVEGFFATDKDRLIEKLRLACNSVVEEYIANCAKDLALRIKSNSLDFGHGSTVTVSMEE